MSKPGEIVGLYPASFDPITVAHVSIAERAARQLNRLYVAVAINPNKNHMFSDDERLDFVEQSIGHIANAKAILLKQGVTVDHAKELGATTLIRGARGVTDFLAEIELFGQNVFAQTSIGIDEASEGFVDTQTYYAMPSQDLISSSVVRYLMTAEEVADRETRLKPLLPEPIFEAVLLRSQEENEHRKS